LRAGCRLVEQQQNRLGDQGAGDLDHALAAIGQGADQTVGIFREAQRRQQVAGSYADFVHAAGGDAAQNRRTRPDCGSR